MLILKQFSPLSHRLCLALVQAVCTISLVLILPAYSQSDDEPLNVVESALRLYDMGKLSEAEHTALRALARSDTLNRLDKYNLHKLLAFVAIANEDDEGGKIQFISALRNNPNMLPDPITWSPKVRRVFELARLEFQREQNLELRKMLALEAEIGRSASIRSLIFPGYGQYYKGQRSKSAIIASSFLASASLLIYNYIIQSDLRQRYLDANNPIDAQKRWKEYRDNVYMVNITAIMAISIYSYSYFDALWASPKRNEDK